MKHKSKAVQMIAGLILMALLAVACVPTLDNGEAKPETEAVPPTISFLDGDWILSELTVEGNTFELPAGNSASLLIAGDKVSGSTGCNTFTGTATFDKGNVSFGPLATTRKACPEALMTLEQAVLKMYENVSTYSGGRTALELSNADGTTVARFIPKAEAEAVAAAPTISFLDGKWAIGAITLDGKTLQLPYGNAASLMIEGDKVSGFAGCNNFKGTATFDHGSVSFSPLATTRKACADETVTAFETALLSVFDKATVYAGGRTELTISNDDASASVSLTPVREQTLFIGAEQVDCVGVGPRKCLLVKENAEGDYLLFFDKISGFEWEPGFEYELLVEISDVANPPADASSLHYELVQIVDKVAVSGN